jgi:hypothetical protein
MCEKYLYGSEGGAGHDRPYPYRDSLIEAGAPGWSVRPRRFATLTTPSAPSLRSAQPPLLCEEVRQALPYQKST